MTYRLKSLIRNLWFGPGLELLCKWLFRLQIEIDYMLLPLEWDRSNPNNLSSDRDRLDYDLWFDHAVRAIAITHRDVYIKHFNRITAIWKFNLIEIKNQLYMKSALNHVFDLARERGSLVTLEINMNSPDVIDLVTILFFSSCRPLAHGPSSPNESFSWSIDDSHYHRAFSPSE